MKDIFETKQEYYWYKGKPVLEILRNGDTFWEELPGAKEHFSFGRAKALIILSCIGSIKKFADTGGEQPGLGKPAVHPNIETGDNCEVTYHDGFKRQGGWVNLPYLEIVSENTSIGLGRLKSQAVVQLEQEIRNFVEKTKRL